MKKTHNSTDSRSDSAELPIRLYRAISDVVRHLDDQRARTEHVCDLFTESIETQRIKLRDYCDKLMFTDPVNYGRKAEDLLWRKVFYEIVGTVKRLNKNVKMDVSETFLIQTHLQSGIGYYHHLIMKLQTHFRLDLRGIVDFPLLITDCGLKKDKNWWNGKAIESSALEWAHHALHRCLIYLGDISRYLSDLQSSYDHNFAQRYYVQALNWKPECGMPHNQLGTLATNLNYSLDSAYYYMRCLCCAQKFDGAEGNLLHLMENNAKCLEEMNKGNGKTSVPNVKKLIVTFIHISYCMFYDKSNLQINQLCTDAFSALEVCMAETEPNVITIAKKSPSADPALLNDDMLFKMMIISIMCVQQLKVKNSPQTMGGVALCLALMSQLVQCALKRIEEVLTPRVEPTTVKKITLQHRRRRRRNHFVGDLSEDENDSVYSLDSDSEEDLIFDQCNDSDEETLPNGNVATNGSYSAKDYIKSAIDHDSSKPWRLSIVSKDKTFQHIQKLCQEGFIFQTLKVSFNWIFSNQAFLKSCGATSTPLITRLVNLLNHLGAVPQLSNLKEFFDDDIVSEDTLCSIPLPEDVAVRGLSSLHLSHSKLNWDYLRTKILKPSDETYSRICSMIRFGKYLAQSKITILYYDEEKQWFSIQTNNNNHKNGIIHHQEPLQKTLNVKLLDNTDESTDEIDNDKRKHQINGFRTVEKKQEVANDKSAEAWAPKVNGVYKKETTLKDALTETPHQRESDPARLEKLMQNMGELWLRSEVSQLEDKTRKGLKENLPPYLVPDAEAFLNHPSLIKQLISAKKFIVLIPTIVVSALDECKQGSGKVRDTIRWLEWQLRNGKRNIRIQRANEHQFIPYIKYPKKKDKEAWMFMQVVECCNYLCNQSTGEKNPELVTLLTGSKALLSSNQPTNGYSHISVAKSAGINVEHIETFFSKWKSSSKSHG